MSEKKVMKSGLQLGVNPNATREENDFYATNPHALEIFIDELKSIGLNKNVWECSCGQGHLSKVLENNGYNVISSDLINRGYGVGDVDFLECSKQWNGDILTNPPFKLAEKFVEKAMELIFNGNKLVLFLKVQFLESKSRKELFKKYPPKYVYINSERQQCCKDAEFDKYTATTQCYCWYIWEKGYEGEPTVRWI